MECEIKINREEMLNTTKILLYKECPGIFQKINYEDDSLFLNPLLFAYFNSKKNKLFPTELIEEILQGYFVKNEQIKLKYSYNKNNIAYIPEMGYFRKGDEELFEPILNYGEFEILKEVHPVLEEYFVEFYKGHILDQNPKHKSVWDKHKKMLFSALDIIKTHTPEFYKELTFANSKIYLHDNPKILNFTSIETLGMLYFYVVGSKNLIYFIEELIHQGSHNYLYYLVQNRKEYFKVDVDNLIMRNLTKQKWDYRTIYGAFHGLFTVAQRVKYFDELLDKNIFTGRNKHELLGRLTDQFSRFRTGLQLLNLKEIYTEKGVLLYNQLDTTCESTLKKYEKLRIEFDLSNRDLDFRYDKFCELNTYNKFLEKDLNGYFNF